MENLECRNNLITNLDVSGCKNLIWLNISDNQFSVNALNDLFRTLSTKKRREKSERILFIGNNPGTNDCNGKIAKGKGWTVYSN